MKKNSPENKLDILSSRFSSAKDLLDYLNESYNKLHTKYENYFWLSYMGDHSVDALMNKAQIRRDSFRSNAVLKTETDYHLKKSSGEYKNRLKSWNHFFGLYQTPVQAVPFKKKAIELETKILRKRTKRTEGYIDPRTHKFVEASENKMRAVMRTNPDEATRQACFEAMEKLPLDYIDEYVEVVRVRNEFARTLGYADFYEYKARIDENMSKKELFSVFEDVYEKTKYAFKNVRQIEKTRPGLRKPWNFAYMMTGDFVEKEDQYFQFENVLSYWGRSFAALGIDFQGGEVRLDLLDRKGKSNNGFCHYPKLVQYKDGRRISGSSGFSSNAIPRQVGSGAQGIHTVFHEGGHAADRLNSFQKDACVNSEYPPSTVSWAETHSMFMDTISSSVEWRTRYAKNDAGDPYPFELFEKEARALHMLRPLDMMSICFVVFFEKEIYECKNLTREFVIKAAQKASKKYLDRSLNSISILNVPHIYSWESSAYYHGYGLAKLGVSQWREYFFKKYGYIVDNPKIGEELKKIWSYASVYSAKKLIFMATGKKLSPDAFIRDVTRPIDDIIVDAKAKIRRLDKVRRHTRPINLGGKIIMMHGKKKITDNSTSFESMDKKYKAWLRTAS
ncbi:MAG: hypothetical protein A3C79_00730 [Candidatus Taylorbacteria bacterium RIFCSPHIGHO2_02_FULL_45_28]|uniref:Peptidase M3A/M3B catalytic domain-containing protein n=1 Tax=Candidatus Taylorbacteria bacterium RIFCSPHIGHO2_12_FULL_45_16 TaxID=1802315 RepID=A0A1G2N1K3_9BACT|nr:MAG: hypothetical protein A2830_01985 [Candidatus Taylorbacteria bacterium RIFCSPHIGHO2_01_FULL_44_110]OHA25545.1 MAG: hypothetical protein A3C79_00730 [Candidatus Taylorbacteria bacterium RIFCSPHIGHO2_02_FULL_45_28]OHA29212.1 MAG: hypothetical protein A3F51_01195 [Candidatus Taylorbacteria bacterium RIFCSPHIGHO2_12_FULL_45_16]OHA33434.1 MAG: hypothetical protein A3A23_02075 [Candidatus Taylorbacteria bacterium RIFCSPLOWO2_01_FULL_45_59]OHA39235.1 MAG: hypothetical protein A3I98_02210 [Candi